MKKSNYIKVYLDKGCKKKAYCDRNEYFAKYGEFDKDGSFKKMVIGEANKGKHHSEETKKKMSEAHKGKHWRLENEKRVWY